MFKVFDNTFSTFEDVIKWAWNEHKIDVDPEAEMPATDEEKHEQCKMLEEMLEEERQ